MSKNTGLRFEERVYGIVENLVKSGKFLVSMPYIQVHMKKAYYSKDRESNIICDVTVEKYLENPDENPELRPSLIVVLECKDYGGSIPVDDVEEFHAKLQQIGADGTKGIIMISGSSFQSGALTYAKSMRIGLARILPDNQVEHIMYSLASNMFSSSFDQMAEQRKITSALTHADFCNYDGVSFFSLTGESSLEEMIGKLLK